MNTVVHYLPGLLAAAVAFVVLRVVMALDLQSMFLELLIFLAAYLVVAVLAERAMRAYGKTGP